MSNRNCKDCGKDTYKKQEDYYMVRHELWKVWGVGMLCMSCMEDRLGRKLNSQDILKCPLAEEFNPYTKEILNKE